MNTDLVTDNNSESYSQLLNAARAFSIISLLVGIMILAGWIFENPLLQNFIPVGSAFRPFTALGLIAASVSLFLQCAFYLTRLIKNISLSLATVPLLLGIVTFVLPSATELVTLANAINFTLSGLALLLFEMKVTEMMRPSQIFAIMISFLPLHSLIFYTYGVESINNSGFNHVTSMGQPAAVAWLCLAVGILLSKPNKGLVKPFAFDREISTSWRSILLTGIIVPLIFGFIFSLGYRKGLYGPEFGFSILALTSVFMMAFFIWRSAHHNWVVRMNQIEVENKVKQALQLRDEFLSIASHELKTPLTSLSLQAQISKLNLLRDYAHPHALTKEQFLNFLTKMDFQVVRLAQLVEDMLDISRIDSGRFSPVLDSTNVKKLVDDVVEQLQPQIEAAECTVTICVPKPIVAVWDAYRIEQVLINLISNALKYGSKKPIIIEVIKKQKSVHLSVKDYGIGIALENQQRIFNRFERAVSAKGITGLGLGLYIVKQIVESHQGQVIVKSELNQGTTFTVILPIRPMVTELPNKMKDTNYGISS